MHREIKELPLVVIIIESDTTHGDESKASWQLYMCDVSVVKCEGNHGSVVLAHALMYLIVSVQIVRRMHRSFCVVVTELL